MPHPPELIASIKAKLEQTYPEADGYRFVIEQALAGSPRFFPDIQVLRRDKVQCVVEIGYTRPEKLKYYRKAKIPDVRWYSKAGELVDGIIEAVFVMALSM